MNRTADKIAATADGTGSIRKVREWLDPVAGSALNRYRALTFPQGTLLSFWLFEAAVMLLLPLPGGLGLALRQRLLRPFFGRLGKDVIIGRNCVFRNPHRIYISDRVVIDDNCVIDARGAGDAGLHLAEGALLSRGVQVKSKGGSVYVGKNVNVGDNTLLVSMAGISIGDEAAIASGCQIVGGTFATAEFKKPASKRISTTAGPIRVGRGTWLATSVVVLDAACIGEDCIVSAGSVVVRSLPSRCVAHGAPAKPIFLMR